MIEIRQNKLYDCWFSSVHFLHCIRSRMRESNRQHTSMKRHEATSNFADKWVRGRQSCWRLKNFKIHVQLDGKIVKFDMLKFHTRLSLSGWSVGFSGFYEIAQFTTTKTKQFTDNYQLSSSIWRNEKTRNEIQISSLVCCLMTRLIV